MQLLNSGWRWSVRFGAAAAAALAVAAPASAAVDGHDNVKDPGSLYTTAQTVMGAHVYWDRGFTGKGVDVALIDTGVAPVKGLSEAGQVVQGPDLSFDSPFPEVRQLDTFGHGTHMGGIIAGRDPGVTNIMNERADKFLGVAPSSRLVSLKLGNAHGAVDVSQVVAAIDWVVKNRRSNGLNIRVLNLSYGTDSAQVYTSDPIAHAVQQAWRQGIVVVVSAGNAGFSSGRLNNPAHNPNVIAVGGQDGKGTATNNDDVVPDFSNAGDGVRGPDLVAPAVSVASLRDPGSLVDVTYPGAVVADRFFRGSGTSQSAAFVSGAAALVIEQRPSITPDQLKALFMRNAQKLSNVSSNLQGAGALNLRNVLTASTPTSRLQSHAGTTGTGTIDGARGNGRLELDGIVLDGERDIHNKPWAAADWAAKSANQTSWVGGTFNGSLWAGEGLLDGVWANVAWEGTDWTGSRWTGSTWTGSRWTGSRWTSEGWTGSRWTGSRWTGSRWTSGVWSSAGYGKLGTTSDGTTVVALGTPPEVIADVLAATGKSTVAQVADLNLLP